MFVVTQNVVFAKIRLCFSLFWDKNWFWTNWFL